MKLLQNLGSYLLFIKSLFINREKFRIYIKLTLEECISLGVGSVFIIGVVSLFLGAVTVIQTAANLAGPFVPKFIIGTIVRDMTILEMAPTLTCLILAGKVGSAIAGGIGTMRITEQIDALEVMGINSASYLALPKIIACVITFPMLVVMAGYLTIFSGQVIGVHVAQVVSDADFTYGLRSGFRDMNVVVTIIKSFVFGYLISSISAYYGYMTSGGALEVGESITKALTTSCLSLLAADYLVAELFI
ncbi:MAG TPA: ABC transporter permease [Cytophagales bacterium]|nr:ABC transporter permease [Cytophagales bacterium]